MKLELNRISYLFTGMDGTGTYHVVLDKWTGRWRIDVSYNAEVIMTSVLADNDACTMTVDRAMQLAVEAYKFYYAFMSESDNFETDQETGYEGHDVLKAGPDRPLDL